MAALQVCNPDPPPLAALLVAALLPAPPPAIRDAARRRLSAALRELCQDACFDLRARCGRALIAASWSLGLSDQADALAAAARLAVLTVDFRLSADLIAVIDGARWAMFADDVRIAICTAAAHSADQTADLMQRIGADRRALTPPDGRAALLRAVATVPQRAAEGGGAVWNALTDNERVMIARAAAQKQKPYFAADLLQRMGSDGWSRTPAAVRADCCAQLRPPPCAPLRAAAPSGTR